MAVSAVHHVEGPRRIRQPASAEHSNHRWQSTLQGELDMRIVSLPRSNGHGEDAIAQQVVPKARKSATDVERRSHRAAAERHHALKQLDVIRRPLGEHQPLPARVHGVLRGGQLGHGKWWQIRVGVPRALPLRRPRRGRVIPGGRGDAAVRRRRRRVRRWVLWRVRRMRRRRVRGAVALAGGRFVAGGVVGGVGRAGRDGRRRRVWVLMVRRRGFGRRGECGGGGGAGGRGRRSVVVPGAGDDSGNEQERRRGRSGRRRGEGERPRQRLDDGVHRRRRERHGVA